VGVFDANGNMPGHDAGIEIPLESQAETTTAVKAFVVSLVGLLPRCCQQWCLPESSPPEFLHRFVNGYCPHGFRHLYSSGTIAGILSIVS